MQNNSKERIRSEREVARLQRTDLFTIISIGSALPEPSPLFPYLNAALKHFVATRYRKHGARVFITDIVVFSCCLVLGNVLKTLLVSKDSSAELSKEDTRECKLSIC